MINEVTVLGGSGKQLKGVAAG
uniref:Uncharacterized protein n=1 Tax=Rhizophora mucronata TaxID=61149 RepID=A0A2P2PPL7_RHIMU